MLFSWTRTGETQSPARAGSGWRGVEVNKDSSEYPLPINRCVVQRLLPLTQYTDSSVRRGGVVGTLRNCCFEHRE